MRTGRALRRHGFLLVALAGARSLPRVPLDAPGGFSEVRLSEPFAADGLALQADGRLFAAAPYAGEVLELTSDDGWRSTRVVGRMRTSAVATTTGMTLRANVPDALNAPFNEMTAKPPAAAFEIVRERTE